MGERRKQEITRRTHMPELSNFIPSLSFAHCRRSRWNMIEPVLHRINHSQRSSSALGSPHRTPHSILQKNSRSKNEERTEGGRKEGPGKGKRKRREHAPPNNRRPIHLRRRKDEVQPPAGARVERRRGRHGEHRQRLLERVPVVRAQRVVAVEA